MGSGGTTRAERHIVRREPGGVWDRLGSVLSRLSRVDGLVAPADPRLPHHGGENMIVPEAKGPFRVREYSSAQRFGGTMREATVAGSEGSVHYRVWEPSGRARRIVLIVHGYAEHGGRYAHVADVLSSQGAAVYVPDHIGHGRSDGERALIRDFDHVVDDLETVAAVAAGDHGNVPLVVAGHSMGGLLSARFSERNPDKVAGLVFMGSVIGDWDWARRALEDPSMMEVPSDVAGMSSVEAEQQSYENDPLVYHGLYKRPLLVAEVEALDRFNADLDRLTMPILFMHGVDDPFVPYQTSLDAVLRMPSEDVTVRLFKGDRHELVNERDRDRVIDELARFARRFG